MLTMQLIYAPSYNTPPHDEYTYNPVATSFHEMVLFRNVPIKTTLPLYMSIIGEVLSSLERLVELLYGIAEVSEIVHRLVMFLPVNAHNTIDPTNLLVGTGTAIHYP
jgi:hypothetical protein